MVKHLKFYIIIIIINLSTANVFCIDDNELIKQDSISFDSFNYPVFDTTIYSDKEIQIYMYYVNSILEYQEFKLKRYESVIYILSGIITLILSLLILKWFSKKYEKSFKIVRVKNHDQVPAATVKMIFNYWHIKISLKSIREKILKIKNDGGYSLYDFIEVFKDHGFECHVLKSGFNEMMETLYIPFVVIYNNHMAVLYKSKKERLLLADAYYGYIEINPFYFVNNWFIDKNNETGVFIVLFPGKIQDKKIKKTVLKIELISELEKKYQKQYKFV